jgi:hypothetical protein
MILPAVYAAKRVHVIRLTTFLTNDELALVIVELVFGHFHWREAGWSVSMYL